MKKVAILQSNYIPWKGYFDLIAGVDEFILYDDMQYTRRDWRNRNLIKTPTGVQWLTVPVKTKGNYHQKIFEIEIDGQEWANNHWKSLCQNYKHAPYFGEIKSWLEPIYNDNHFIHLSSLNRTLIEAICKYLAIDTDISSSSDYRLIDGKTERLVDLCIQANGTEYISGPSAKEYIEERFFSENNIKLSWFSYSNYSEYPQLWGKFIHEVSILDLLFNCGSKSPKYIKNLSL